MERAPKSNQLPFLTARARLANRYDINLDTDDFIEKGYYIWRDIGNIASTHRRFSVQVPSDGIVELPSNCEFVESVTSTEVMPATNTMTDRGKYSLDSGGYMQDVRPSKATTSAEDSANTSEEYSYGTSVNYTTGKDFIQITSATMFNRMITVDYTSIDLDTDGLPMINEKEVHAIAANLALQEAEKRFFRGVKGADVLVQYLKVEADRLLQAAKTPERINDDELDKALDIKTSWDRKVYGRRFNPIR